jgi:hypothetical protein
MRHELVENLKKGVKTPFESFSSSLLTLSISFISLVMMALSGSLVYSYQMFSYGPNYWVPLMQSRLTGLYLEGGIIGLFSSIIYSLLIGITLYNFAVQLRNSGLSLRNLSGIGPSFLAAGCAGCGVGLLSLAGLTGAIAVLPFNGQLIRLGGMLLLVYYIAKTGDPRTCSIPSS